MPVLQVDEDDLEDIRTALRVAANCFEMSAISFTPEEGHIEEVSFERARVALRRQASRYRKLAARIKGAD
jgi:hypothetical protein